MKKIYAFGIIVLFAFLTNCSTVPVTGRRQLDLVPSSQLLSLSNAEYSDFLSKHKLSGNAEQTASVKRVGQQIANAVTQYMNQNGLSKSLEGYSWEFNLVDDPQVNAFCMPGGKVVIYTGILPITQDEKGLAVVMGHEISHAVAEHGGERMSQGLVAQLGGMALNVALSSKPEQTRSIFNTAYGVGANVGVLMPFGRRQETEADRLGLIFMAMAGYDPNSAVSFWQRMAAQKQGAAPPEFLSTHPADQTRIRDIQKQIPEAMKYYNAAAKR